MPAGHVDLGETPTACVVREVREELGFALDSASLRPGGTMFRLSQEPRVDILFTTTAWTGTPEIREPHKCTELVWADPEALPSDVLDFIGTAWRDAQCGNVFREFGFTLQGVRHYTTPSAGGSKIDSRSNVEVSVSND